MPRNETILTVFVASPADVTEERAALEDVIRELNNTWSKTIGLRLDLIRWETNAYPDFGIDAQDVINKQIGDDYDIFIGILWTRFGTPTMRAESGTQEEFIRAYSRYKEKGNVHLMLYFKDEPVSPSKIDYKQLLAVSDFKVKLGELGSLYWQFTTMDEFQSFLRIHLSRVVQEWNKSAKALKHNLVSNNNGELLINDNEDDLGYLDYVEIANELLEKSSKTLDRMTQYMTDFGTKAQHRTEELNRVIKSPESIRLTSVKSVMAKSAGDMEEFVARTDFEIPIYSKSLQDALAAIANVLSLSIEYGMDDLKSLNYLLNTISSFSLVMESMIESIMLLRTSFVNLPRMTAIQNRAKNKVLNTLTNYVRESETNLNLIMEVKKAIQDRLDNSENS